MVGEKVGGAVGQAAVGGKDAPQASSPVDREMDRMKSDPTNQLQQGKQALSGMDEQDKVMLQPILDEALKRDAMSRQRRQSMAAPQGGGY
jgi:hypothetical protein